MAEYPRIADRHLYEIAKQRAVRTVFPTVGKDGWQQPPYERRATVIRTSKEVRDMNSKLAAKAKYCKAHLAEYMKKTGLGSRPAFRECMKEGGVKGWTPTGGAA